MTNTQSPPSVQDNDYNKYHTYTTHRIPWYVHVLWIGFFILMVWYVLQFVIPAARSHF